MAYKQRWLVYFDHFDTNHNGFIEPEDFALIGKIVDEVYKPSPGEPSVSKSFAEFITHFIEELDTNKDGKVSKEELLTGVEKIFIGKTFAQAPAWWRKIAATVFNIFDTNKSGDLSLEELTAGIKKLNPNETDENIKQAYNWAKSLSPSGKYDEPAWSNTVFIWATSPEPTPHANVLLPFFGMAGHQSL